jgi:hypothetical protein
LIERSTSSGEAVRTTDAPPIELQVVAGLSATFEIATETAVSYLPSALAPVEIRPDVALASLVFFKFEEGCLHDGRTLPAYSDLTFGVHVSPLLELGVPRFALFAVSIGSSLLAANEFLASVHRLSVHPKLLSAQYGTNPIEAEISDEDGPIARLLNVESDPSWKPDQIDAQIFSESEGRLYVYPESVTGPMCRHQTRGSGVVLSPSHPFFRGGDLEPRPRLYMQSVGKPGVTAVQVAHRARLLSDLDRRRAERR